MVGTSLVGVGVVWTLSNLGRIDMLSTLRTYWPSMLILWGLIELFNELVARDRSVRLRSGRSSGGAGEEPAGRDQSWSSVP